MGEEQDVSRGQLRVEWPALDRRSPEAETEPDDRGAYGDRPSVDRLTIVASPIWNA